MCFYVFIYVHLLLHHISAEYTKLNKEIRLVNNVNLYSRIRRITFMIFMLCWHPDGRASWYILLIKPKRYTNFPNYFWNRTLHVSDRFSVHHQEPSTVYTAIGICHTGFADCLLAGSDWILVFLQLWLWIRCMKIKIFCILFL